MEPVRVNQPSIQRIRSRRVSARVTQVCLWASSRMRVPKNDSAGVVGAVRGDAAHAMNPVPGVGMVPAVLPAPRPGYVQVHPSEHSSDLRSGDFYTVLTHTSGRGPHVSTPVRGRPRPFPSSRALRVGAVRRGPCAEVTPSGAYRRGYLPTMRSFVPTL